MPWLPPEQQKQRGLYVGVEPTVTLNPLHMCIASRVTHPLAAHLTLFPFVSPQFRFPFLLLGGTLFDFLSLLMKKISLLF